MTDDPFDVEVPEELDTTEFTWRPKTMVEIPPDMVASLAMGLDDPDVVAERHGFVGPRWEMLRAWKPFLVMVEAKKAEFQATGVTFRLKAALKAELLADRIFVTAMKPETSLMQQLEAGRFFARMGDLEPKEKSGAQAGGGFSITINMGDKKIETATIVEEVKTDFAVPLPHWTEPEANPLVDPALLEEMRANADSD